MRDRTSLAVIGLAAAFAAVATVLPAWLLQIGVLALARGVAVLGLAVLIRTGLVSFGQALYFGLGGYSVGLLSVKLGFTEAGLGVLTAILVTGAIGATIGALLRRYRGIFFAMLSLAFSMIFYGLLVKSAELGSSDGFPIAPATFFGARPPAGGERLWLFTFTLGVATACAIGVQRYWRSTSGRLAQAVRDNEIRLEYLGVSAATLVHRKIVIASALGGVGGALSAMAVGHVDPTTAFWITSGELVFVAVLSGSGSVIAPFLGAIAFEGLHSAAQHVAPEAWRLTLGASLLAIILFAPGGLWSLLPRRTPA